MAARDVHNEAALAAATALVALVREVAREEVHRAGPAPTDLLDQTTSGLGRRLHCRAFREGKLEGRRLGRRIVVTREALERFLETFGVRAKQHDIGDPVDRQLSTLGLRGEPGERRRRRTALTGTRPAERTSTTPRDEA